MSETTPTPNTMPGATPATPEPPKAESTPAPQAPAEKSDGGDNAELESLRAFRKEAQKWEQRAKSNFDDAERWRQLSKTVGGEPNKEFDPQAEFQKLRDEVARERAERVREAVARTEDVDPDILIGATEEQMRESAQRYKAKVEAAVERLLKGRAPAAAPASEVTSNGKVAGPGQITSQDELKSMSPADRMAAYKDGRLDGLMGKK